MAPPLPLKNAQNRFFTPKTPYCAPNTPFFPSKTCQKSRFLPHNPKNTLKTQHTTLMYLYKHPRSNSVALSQLTNAQNHFFSTLLGCFLCNLEFSESSKILQGKNGPKSPLKFLKIKDAQDAESSRNDTHFDQKWKLTILQPFFGFYPPPIFKNTP